MSALPTDGAVTRRYFLLAAALDGEPDNAAERAAAVRVANALTGDGVDTLCVAVRRAQGRLTARYWDLVLEGG